MNSSSSRNLCFPSSGSLYGFFCLHSAKKEKQKRKHEIKIKRKLSGLEKENLGRIERGLRRLGFGGGAIVGSLLSRRIHGELKRSSKTDASQEINWSARTGERSDPGRKQMVQSVSFDAKIPFKFISRNFVSYTLK